MIIIKKDRKEVSVWGNLEEGTWEWEKKWTLHTPTVLSPADRWWPWWDAIRMAPYLCGLLPQNLEPQSDHEKKHQTNLIWGAFYKIPDLYFSKRHKNKERPGICQNHEEPKEAWQWNRMWYPRWSPWTKRILQVNWGTMNKSWTLVHETMTIWAH